MNFMEEEEEGEKEKEEEPELLLKEGEGEEEEEDDDNSSKSGSSSSLLKEGKGCRGLRRKSIVVDDSDVFWEYFLSWCVLDIF